MLFNALLLVLMGHLLLDLWLILTQSSENISTLKIIFLILSCISITIASLREWLGQNWLQN
jgi:hypothetical protein